MVEVCLTDRLVFITIQEILIWAVLQAKGPSREYRSTSKLKLDRYDRYGTND